MYQALSDICGIPSEADSLIATLTVVCVLVFVVLMCDFLARILSRFVPRWNRSN